MSSRNALKPNFAKDESGGVAIIFALMGTVLILAIGAAVDIGRWQHARSRTLAAIDAAVLAGGRAFQVNANATDALIVAAKLYADNINTRSPVLSDTITFITNSSNTEFTATGNAYIKTPFLKMAMIDSLPLLNSSGSEFAKASLPGGGGGINAATNLEISVMLDITGSMGKPSGTRGQTK